MEESSIPKISKKEANKLLKSLLNQWISAEDQTTRITTLVQIKKLCQVVPSILERCMKDMYLTYTKHTSHVIAENIDILNLMRNCVSEIYSLDATLAYQHAFIYIRQLAIMVRNATQSKSEEDLHLIYNWQFMKSLDLWTHLLTESTIKEDLNPLIYPLVQVIDCTIRLVPTSRYYPLRLHCCQMLIQIAQKQNVHIPISSYLDDLFLQKPSSNPGKAPDLEFTLKLSKTLLHSRMIQDVLISKTLSLLNTYISFYQNTIAYPELVFAVIRNLKPFVKNCKVQHWKDSIKSMIQKFEKQAEYITIKRETLSNSPITMDSIQMNP